LLDQTFFQTDGRLGPGRMSQDILDFFKIHNQLTCSTGAKQRTDLLTLARIRPGLR
jgi:hypothetical protein